MIVTGKIDNISFDIAGVPKLTLQINERGKLLSNFDELKDIDKLSIELKKYREVRSKDSNAYFHLLVNKLANYHNISNEDMKKRMVLKYGSIAKDSDGKYIAVKVLKGTDVSRFYDYVKWYGEVEENGLMLDKYLFYERTHLLDTLQMSNLINGVVDECKECGIETLDEIKLKSLVDSWNPKQ